MGFLLEARKDVVETDRVEGFGTHVICTAGVLRLVLPVASDGENVFGCSHNERMKRKACRNERCNGRILASRVFRSLGLLLSTVSELDVLRGAVGLP